MPRQSTPMTLTLDRIASPVGEVLVATDAEGAVRALDFHDYEDRMRRLLHRHVRPGRTWSRGGRRRRCVGRSKPISAVI